MAKRWMGDMPRKCDFCQDDMDGTFIDGKTRQGPWGIMCVDCHDEHGVGLGPGRGQQYALPGGEKIDG
jgi:hypothetical protein